MTRIATFRWTEGAAGPFDVCPGRDRPVAGQMYARAFPHAPPRTPGAQRAVNFPRCSGCSFSNASRLSRVISTSITPPSFSTFD